MAVFDQIDSRLFFPFAGFDTAKERMFFPFGKKNTAEPLAALRVFIPLGQAK